MKQHFSATKIALIVALSAGSISTPAQAQFAVIDPSNIAQNTVSAVEAAAQTAKQIQQYKTQLEQYENMLQNTIAPAAYIWDKAQSTIKNLMQVTDIMSHYKNTLGSIDAYLSKFQDVKYYKSSPCFSSSGCSASEWAAMKQNEALASESQKKANVALFKSLDQQQTNLQKDAAQLGQLQKAAQGASGQLSAIQYANQLASQQANQLLQIRGLLMAQQNAIATRMQATTDKEAREEAATEELLQGGPSFKPSPERSW